MSVLLGAGLAVLAAVAWAGQYVFVRLATVEGSTTDAVAVALICNVVLVVPPAFVLWDPSVVARGEVIATFVAAGLAGSLLGRLCQFRAIETIGASRTAPVVASTALFSAALAVAFLGETLTGVHAVGILLVVGGVAYISWKTATDPADPRPVREVGLSLALPLLAALCFAVEPVFISWGLAAGAPVVPGLAVKAVAATAGFLAYLALVSELPDRARLAGPSLRWYVASGVASTAALLAYFLALEVAPVVVVVPIVQVAPLIVLVLSRAFLPRGLERVTWDLAVAATVVVAGAVVVSVSG
jgi:drug/metabolite transporter (DMT)-like permease